MTKKSSGAEEEGATEDVPLEKPAAAAEAGEQAAAAAAAGPRADVVALATILTRSLLKS